MGLLTVENLGVGYHTRNGFIKSVEGVSFELEQGKSLGFVGESGCGKTTIGMALMGLLPGNASVFNGRIMFENQNLLDMGEDIMRKIRWKKISMIFQAAMNALNPVYQVKEQIAEAILTHESGVSAKQALKKVKELFHMVGIPDDRMEDYPHQYSGGMKQRAVIAMALACNPLLIIADEPTTALDVIVQAQILQAIKNAQKKMGIGLVFISHDIAVVADVCDDIGIMYSGRLVEYGKRSEVFDAPIHPYTKELLASYITLDGDVVQPMLHKGPFPIMQRDNPGCRFCHRCPVAENSCKIKEPEWIKITQTHRVFCTQCH